VKKYRRIQAIQRKRKAFTGFFIKAGTLKKGLFKNNESTIYNLNGRIYLSLYC
jgi:hypothetical protein